MKVDFQDCHLLLLSLLLLLVYRANAHKVTCRNCITPRSIQFDFRFLWKYGALKKRGQFLDLILLCHPVVSLCFPHPDSLFGLCSKSDFETERPDCAKEEKENYPFSIESERQPTQLDRLIESGGERRATSSGNSSSLIAFPVSRERALKGHLQPPTPSMDRPFIGGIGRILFSVSEGPRPIQLFSP